PSGLHTFLITCHSPNYVFLCSSPDLLSLLSFPTRRSSDLFVTRLWFHAAVAFDRRGPAYVIGEDATDRITYAPRPVAEELTFLTDRKSTRLNSSHVSISYAVFCLKKK